MYNIDMIYLKEVKYPFALRAPPVRIDRRQRRRLPTITVTELYGRSLNLVNGFFNVTLSIDISRNERVPNDRVEEKG